ncbi:MAG: hypothetical protein K9J84_14370 [Bacteroidia bacterium]|nr:hypothetical protein [Bacteroidia bacterium]
MKTNLNVKETFLKESIDSIKLLSHAKKQVFDFKDAVRLQHFGTDRDKVLINALLFIQSNPLRNNDYYKYLHSYKVHGKKLQDRYFKHSLTHLHELYERYEKEEVNPFNIDAFESYVLYMALKLKGQYIKTDDVIFNVKANGNREYNPLSKIPTILRSCLPFDVMEFDIKRAFPTFIDIELQSNYRTDIYEKISKQEFSMYLNSNAENKGMTIEVGRNKLACVYGERVNEVITDERFNNKGKVFDDFTSYEKKYIELFIKENKLINYARLHDGVFVLKGTECKHTKFDTVEFSVKECIKPIVENTRLSFYSIGADGNVQTSPVQYADFLKQERIVRISTSDDKIQLLKNTNNVIDYFNYKTDMLCFLEDHINEAVTTDVRNTLAKDNYSALYQSYHLLPYVPLEYYKDSKERFGLPFKNGFHYFDSLDQLAINKKDYSGVKGFFAPHKMQKREFNYTDEIGNFELFVQRIATGKKEFDRNDIDTVQAFNSMIGYLVHNKKSRTESPCIILTDEGANDETRDGGRGKTALAHGLAEVTKTMKKGGSEFVGSYIHNFADLDQSYNLYLIDDVPASFNWNDLYTNITEGINVQPKGSKGRMIEFEDSPKFLVTTNWLIRYNKDDTSTNRRFIEYKVKPYYTIDHTPRHEFNETFFEDWDAAEWNKFYSFIFRCTHSYLKNGLQRIVYDKTEDNFKAMFGSDAKESEMRRILDELIVIKDQKTFTVSDVLSVYNRFDNPLAKEKFFHARNTRELVDAFLSKTNKYPFVYSKKWRKWDNIDSMCHH